MESKLLILLLNFSVLFNFNNAQTDKVVCYFFTGLADIYPPEQVDVNICTHINFAFVGIEADGSLTLNEPDILTRVSNLKSINPNLKVLLSVGGGLGSANFPPVAADPVRKQRLADDSIRLLQQYNCDGIDIDWEFPGQGSGGTPADKENFIDLLWILRGNFEQFGYLVTTAVSALGETESYNIGAISEVVDYINVMTYDYHWGETITGQNSPLYPSSIDSDWQRRTQCVDCGITIWLDGGASPSKLLVGLAFYGRTLQLANPDLHGLGDPVLGVGMGDGGLSYREICTLIDGWTTVWDDQQKVPYKYGGDQWIGFDDPASIREKVLYARNRGLGGVMMWAVNHDDYQGVCGQPLLDVIRDTLKQN